MNEVKRRHARAVSTETARQADRHGENHDPEQHHAQYPAPEPPVTAMSGRVGVGRGLAGRSGHAATSRGTIARMNAEVPATSCSHAC